MRLKDIVKKRLERVTQEVKEHEEELLDRIDQVPLGDEDYWHWWMKRNVGRTERCG